jgi:hypothetical protein
MTDLSHEFKRGDPTFERPAMSTIGGNDTIIVTKSCERTNGYSFLASAGMY